MTSTTIDSLEISPSGTVKQGQPVEITFDINVGDDDDSTTDEDARVTTKYRQNGTVLTQNEQTVTEGDIISDRFTRRFGHGYDTTIRYSCAIIVEVEFLPFDNLSDAASPDQTASKSFKIDVSDEQVESQTQYYTGSGSRASPGRGRRGSAVDSEVTDTPGGPREGGPTGTSSSTLDGALSTRPDVSLRSITPQKRADNLPTEITFDGYGNPTVSVDGGARYKKHKIIGGSVVRQKVGTEPLNISVKGVCYGDTAREIDALRDSKQAVLVSDRLPGGSVDVQVGSTSTEPLDDGGAGELTSGELLYSYTINLIEIDQ